jgi:hypothetical protein
VATSFEENFATDEIAKWRGATVFSASIERVNPREMVWGQSP